MLGMASLTLTDSQTHSLTHTLTHTFTHSYSLTLTHTLTLTDSHSLTRSLTHSLTLTHTHTHTHSHIYTRREAPMVDRSSNIYINHPQTTCLLFCKMMFGNSKLSLRSLARIDFAPPKLSHLIHTTSF